MSSSTATGRPARLVNLDALDGDALLGCLHEVVWRLRGQPLSGAMDDDALSASVGALHRVEAMVHAEKLRRVAEVDSRKAYLGRALSTADLLAAQLG